MQSGNRAVRKILIWLVRQNEAVEFWLGNETVIEPSHRALLARMFPGFDEWIEDAEFSEFLEFMESEGRDSEARVFHGEECDEARVRQAKIGFLDRILPYRLDGGRKLAERLWPTPPRWLRGREGVTTERVDMRPISQIAPKDGQSRLSMDDLVDRLNAEIGYSVWGGLPNVHVLEQTFDKLAGPGLEGETKHTPWVSVAELRSECTWSESGDWSGSGDVWGSGLRLIWLHDPPNVSVESLVGLRSRAPVKIERTLMGQTYRTLMEGPATERVNRGVVEGLKSYVSENWVAHSPIHVLEPAIEVFTETHWGFFPPSR